jgi:adrenodoxin-NADP+ reductase
MKVCVVGGGPAGLYSASYLLANNVDVTLYEREGELGGNYKYALLPEARFSPFREMLRNPKLTLKLNTTMDHSKFRSIEKDFDGFVIATGAQGRRRLRIPGACNCIDGLDVVRSYHGLREALAFGKKVLIVGMGNVALDICKYLLGWRNPYFRFPEEALEGRKDVGDVTVISRSNMHDSAFSNSELRSLLEIPNIAFKWEEGKVRKVSDERWWLRRRKLFETERQGDRRLRFLFDTNILSIDRANGKHGVRFMRDGREYTEVFDSVISSIGFESPHRHEFVTDRPIFYIGWVSKPQGDINRARADAYGAMAKMIEMLGKRSQAH